MLQESAQEYMRLGPLMICRECRFFHARMPKKVGYNCEPSRSLVY